MNQTWKVLYHPEVDRDLRRIGKSRAKRAIKAIDEKLLTEPETFGASLRKDLAGLRKLRVGDVRIVYRVEKERIEVLVITIGKRADGDVYKVASSRKEK
ncbi:MAG: type II toxin-antitoxin system RelE/ParE family toxin [Mariprofundaceae bacterium]|nr:type II toxin-antitoxin system RelE/ParE family toxin [Mariprofundaceae bacterium]